MLTAWWCSIALGDTRLAGSTSRLCMIYISQSHDLTGSEPRVATRDALLWPRHVIDIVRRQRHSITIYSRLSEECYIKSLSIIAGYVSSSTFVLYRSPFRYYLGLFRFIYLKYFLPIITKTQYLLHVSLDAARQKNWYDNVSSSFVQVEVQLIASGFVYVDLPWMTKWARYDRQWWLDTLNFLSYYCLIL